MKKNQFFVIFLIILSFEVIKSELSRDQQNNARNLHGTHSSAISSGNETEKQQNDVMKIAIDDRLSQYVHAMIDHFKNPDPVGLPLPIPDPLEAPDVPEESFTVGKIAMSSIRVSGVSKFRLHSSSVSLDKIVQGHCHLTFEHLVITGNYVLKALLQTKRGPFKIELKGVSVEGASKFATDKKGKLKSEDIEAKVDIARKSFEFQNAESLQGIIQSILNSDSLFNIIKAKIIKKSEATIKAIIDEKIEDTLAPFGLLPNSISPVDFAIAEGRKFIRNGYDPFLISDHEVLGMVGYRIHGTELNGLSSIYRMGDIKLKIDNGSAIANIELGTGELHGKTFWEVSLVKGMITRGGKLNFKVNHLKIMLTATQPVDLRKKLVINDLQIELGNVQVMSTGLGSFDYLVEFFINTIPNILRYQIVDALERPILYRILEYTNQQVPETLVKEKLKEYIKSGAITLDIFKKEEL